MYIIVVGYINGDVEYYGPFPTEERANKYGLSIDEQLKPRTWFVKPLTVPYVTVVKRIEWVLSEPLLVQERRRNFLDGR